MGMSLCGKCSLVDFGKLIRGETGRDERDRVQHHATSADLARAAEGGCQLCQILTEAVLASLPQTSEDTQSSAAKLRDFAFTASVPDCHHLYSPVRAHKDCPSDHANTLPTRVIRVNSSGQDPRLQLTHGESGQYVALSHCWGDSRPLTTNTLNLESHLERIPMRNMPATFRDAVEVTRTLGFQYLWIDSLCIVQDDKADWENECTRMSDVYSGCTVCIAALAASDAHGGLFCQGDWQDRRFSHTLELPYSSTPMVSQEAFVLAGPVDSSDFSSLPLEKNQLLQRAWVVQERLLSPRVLYFGQQDVFLECGSAYYMGERRYPQPMETTSVVRDARKNALFSQDGRLLLRRWYKIVNSYSRCGLTEGGDKLPAMSGLAAFLGPKLGMRYAAGLWEEDIVFGLSWTAEIDWRRPNIPIRKKARHPGPSWSWAGCEGSIYYNVSNPRHNLGLSRDDPRRGRSHLLQEEQENVGWSSQARLDSLEVVPAGGNQLGEVLSGTLIVTGKRQPIVVKPSAYLGQFEVYSPHQAASSEIIRSPPTFRADRISTLSRDLIGAQCLLLGHGSDWRKTASWDAITSRKYVALVIVPTAKEKDAWERVGAIRLDPTASRRAVEFVQYTFEGDERQLRLV